MTKGVCIFLLQWRLHFCWPLLHCCVFGFMWAMETAEGSMRTLAAGTRRGIHLASPFLGAPRFGWPNKNPNVSGPLSAKSLGGRRDGAQRVGHQRWLWEIAGGEGLEVLAGFCVLRTMRNSDCKKNVKIGFSKVEGCIILFPPLFGLDKDSYLFWEEIFAACWAKISWNWLPGFCPVGGKTAQGKVWQIRRSRVVLFGYGMFWKKWQWKVYFLNKT